MNQFMCVFACIHYNHIKGNAEDGCGLEWKTNTLAIQQTIDTATTAGTPQNPGCVRLSGGDYISADLSLKSNLVLRIEDGTRLLSAVNQTRRALLLLEHIHNVEIVGPGMVYGNAEHYISFYDPVDDR